MRSAAFALMAAVLACPWATAGSPRPTAATLWTAADLDSVSLTLERTGAPYTQIIKGKTCGVLVLRRAVSGSPELHVKLNDFFVILSGKGRIEVGGNVTGAKTVAPQEMRGERLTGGALYRVRRGDVLFVPANHWLQVLLAQGEVLRAIIIKTR